MNDVSPHEAEVGVWYAVAAWDPEDELVGIEVRGRLASKQVKLKRYPGDTFWLLEDVYVHHLVDETWIQQVTEIRRW